MMNQSFVSMIENAFSRIIHEYGLRVCSIHDSVLLIGSNYALEIGLDRDKLDDVMYIDRDKTQKFAAYKLTALMFDRWTSEDRQQYGTPITRDERILGALRIDASAFYHRCRDLLSGDKSWLKREQWRYYTPQGKVADLLERELPLTQ